MREAGVATIAVGADLASSKEAVKIAMENENIWACIGVHPNHNLEEVFDEKNYEELIKNPKVVAIGECGLDYYNSLKSKAEGQKEIQDKKNKQKKDFINQIEFAIKYDKPLMLHIRDGLKQSESFGQAFSDAYEILKNYDGKVKGNLHFFTGDLAQAQKFIDLGFTISFTGLITYPPKQELGRAGIQDFYEVIKSIPLDKIQAETDAPFVAPVPYRGKRNEPSYVIEVVKKITEIRGEDFEVVRRKLLENAKRIFGL